MSYVTWQEKFRIGVDEIDRDHKLLFDLVDQFHESYARGLGQAEMDRVFGALGI